MNTELKQAAQQALDALEARCGTNADERQPGGVIEALRTAIQQPTTEQAPMMKHQVIDAALIVAPTLWVDYMCAVSFEAGIRAAEAHHGITDAPTASDA